MNLDTDVLEMVEDLAVQYHDYHQAAKRAEESKREIGKQITDLMQGMGLKTAQLDHIRITIKDNGSKETIDRAALLKAGVTPTQILAATKKGKPSFGPLVKSYTESQTQEFVADVSTD